MNANHSPTPIPQHYTPEQLLAILDLLEILHDTISDQLQLARDQLDLFQGSDEDDLPDHDEMPF